MSIALENVVFDCTDAAALATFWADVLSSEVDADGNQFFATVNRSAGGPTLMFVQVPEPRSGKNRLHLDLGAPEGGRAAEVARLVGLGATVLGERGGDAEGLVWTTLTDPEGNEFCVAEH